MTNQLFQVPSMIESVATRVDNTLKATIGMPELSPEQSAALFSLKGKSGFFVFKLNEIRMEDIPDEPAPEFRDEVSPSKRLKSCLYIYWRDHTSKNPDFDSFYKSWMNKKIEEIKDKLN